MFAKIWKVLAYPDWSIDSEQPLAHFEREAEVVRVAGVLRRLAGAGASAQLVVVRRVVQVIFLWRSAVAIRL